MQLLAYCVSSPNFLLCEILLTVAGPNFLLYLLDVSSFFRKKINFILVCIDCLFLVHKHFCTYDITHILVRLLCMFEAYYNVSFHKIGYVHYFHK